jgi:hypothetical protein
VIRCRRRPICGEVSGGGGCRRRLASPGGLRPGAVSRARGCSPGVTAAANRGGRRARAGPDGEKQRAWHLEPRLNTALVRDEAPLSDGAAPVGCVQRTSSVERREMANGESEALACGRRVENILTSMLNARRG